MKRLAFVLNVLLGLSLAIGCSHQGGPRGGSPPPPSDAVSIELTAGDDRVTIKSGEAANLPATTMNVVVRFSTAVDWYSVSPNVQPGTWHFESKNRVPEANAYNFLIRPDSGATGTVTVSIDDVLGTDGKPALRQPIVFYVHTSPR